MAECKQTDEQTLTSFSAFEEDRSFIQLHLQLQLYCLSFGSPHKQWHQSDICNSLIQSDRIAKESVCYFSGLFPLFYNIFFFIKMAKNVIPLFPLTHSSVGTSNWSLQLCHFSIGYFIVIKFDLCWKSTIRHWMKATRTISFGKTMPNQRPQNQLTIDLLLSVPSTLQTDIKGYDYNGSQIPDSRSHDRSMEILQLSTYHSLIPSLFLSGWLSQQHFLTYSTYFYQHSATISHWETVIQDQTATIVRFLNLVSVLFVRRQVRRVGKTKDRLNEIRGKLF